jgi:hypothetical protein
MIVSPLDAPLAFVLGAVAGIAYRYRLRRRNPDWFVLLGAAATVLAWANLAVATVVGTRPWGVAPTVETGSVVLGLAYPLAVPLWFWLGGRAAFVLLGRRPAEGGLLWLYTIDDETESFDRSWDS